MEAYHVFLNTSSHALSNGFATQVAYPTGSGPYSVAIGDLIGNGKPDLAVANLASNTISVLLNQGNGTFPSSANYTLTTGKYPYSVAIGDLIGNGKPDIAVANENSNTVSVFMNQGNGNFLSTANYTLNTGSDPVLDSHRRLKRRWKT